MGYMTESLNHTPFLIAAYAIGTTLIVGYLLYNVRERQKLRRMLESLKT